MNGHAYPLRLTGRLDAPLSRWLWLVKWLLAIPHYLILLFLWMGAVLAGIAALVGILVTGRYPPRLFDYLCGVLRWTWRVQFYAYGALGTDRYPPFTLADVPDYPARLEVTPPQSLSRGLVLVKWWLLAIPHYLIVSVLVGGGLWAATGSSGTQGAGLISLLAVIGGVFVLIGRAYPTPLFDLVVGLNRWVYRVAAYALLMTDDYPPFRLDMGPEEPATEETPARPASPPVGPVAVA